jgi:hypothetical protein
MPMGLLGNHPRMRGIIPSVSHEIFQEKNTKGVLPYKLNI